MLICAWAFCLVFLTPLFSEEVNPPGASSLLEEAMIKPQDASYENAFIKMILTLGGLLLLVFFTLWALRKISNGKVGGFGSQKRIKVLEKKPLSPKTAIYLLELDGKSIFVAESQLEVKTILGPQEIEELE